MLLPDKHIRLSESIFGLGSFVLEMLKTPMTVDVLWKQLKKSKESNVFPAYQSFDNLVLALDLLFILGLIQEDNQGKISRCVY